MNHVEIAVCKLRQSAKITAGARFNAARRLKKRDWFGTFSIAMFSAISIGIAAVQKVYAFSTGSLADNYLTALSISIGLFVVVISLIEWGVNARLHADMFQKNAEDLNHFRRELDLRLAKAEDGFTLSHEEADLLNEKYERIMRSCPINHETIDKELFDIEESATLKANDWNATKIIDMVYKTRIRLNTLLSGIRYFLVFWLFILALLAIAILKY